MIQLLSLLSCLHSLYWTDISHQYLIITIINTLFTLTVSILYYNIFMKMCHFVNKKSNNCLLVSASHHHPS